MFYVNRTALRLTTQPFLQLSHIESPRSTMLRRTHGSGNTNCLSHRHANTHDTIGSVSSVSTRYAPSRHQKPFQAQREKTTIRQIVWFAILDGRFRLSGSVRIMYIDNEQCFMYTTSAKRQPSAISSASIT